MDWEYFYLIVIFAIGFAMIIISIILGNKERKDAINSGVKVKAYVSHRDMPDEELISSYKRCAEKLVIHGTKNISSWMEQQAVQSGVNRLESYLTMYGDELKARGYKIDYSNPKNIKIWKD